MTAARAARLTAFGLEWNPSAGGHDASWEAQLAKLKAYRHRHGDCNVPQRWVEDPTLGRWVNDQRKRKKALDCGDPSEGMTAAWAARLEALGFA